MKNIGTKKNIIRVVICGAVLCVMLGGCKNFLNAGKVKEEIEQQIYINNNECPVATVEEPVFSDGGVAWNKTIIITFSLPMDPDSFIGNYTIKDSDGISVMDNYMAPEWANNNTKVVIYANELNPLIIPEGKTKDLYITLSKKCKTKDGLPIKTVINHKYRLNSINENVPPVLAPNTNVKRPLIKYNNVTITNPVTLVEGQLNAQNEDLICTTNHVKSDLEFYVEGSDFGGGKVSAKISYGLVYDVDGKAVASATQETIIEELTDKTEGENYSKTISFNFDSNPAKEYADGMYKFTIYIVDQYGLKSDTEKHYFVIRDTKMAKSASALIWFESPNFRQDFTKNEEKIYPAPFDQTVPTGQKIDELRQKVQFQFINDDTYYISSFDNTKIYTDKFELGNFQFLFSWGTSLDDLTAPVLPLSVTSKTVVDYYGYEIPEERVDLVHPYGDDRVTYDSWLNNWLIDTYGQELVGTGTDVRNMGNKTVFSLPLAYEEYVQNHLNKDIFMQVTVIDSVGNSNTITTVSPKKPEFYGYKVESGENDSKKVTLSYSDHTGADLTSIVNIPDKKCIENYRIFAAPLPAGCDENNTDNIALERTTIKRWVEDQFSGITDSNIINIPKNADGTYSKYVVYIQPNYSTNSILSGRWTGQTFGPYYKVIIDPYKGSEGWVDPDPDTNPLPASISISSIEHESAGQSTGLLNVTVTLSEPDDRYVPCYTTKDISSWVYPDFTISEDKTKLYFTMENPLRAPIKRIDKDSDIGRAWRQEEGRWDNGDPKYLFREDFWESVERLKEKRIYNYTYDVEIKVQASGGNNFVESAARIFTLDSEKDDNIPPHQSDRITTHDSRLSLDGHYFEFWDLIIDDQAHLVKTFTYYYTPYNEAWGDNLSVLSEEQIKALPYGISKLKSNCYLDNDWDIPENDRTDRIVMSFCPIVPVKGLEDGKYMFFGEFSDSFGNTCIITLGKADIGTLKNRPNVSWSVESEANGGDTIKIDFTREPYENFENYYVYIETLDTSKGVWYSLFDGYSSLQKLDFNGGNKASLTINCKTPSYTDWDNKNKRFKQNWTLGDRHGDRDNSGDLIAKHLPRWTHYKVTVQAFNTHPYDKATGTGVNWYYDMPYKDYDPTANNSNWNPYSGQFEGYINGETEYDLCTQECASCSTYMYFPGYEIDGEGKIHYTEQLYDLNDPRYSFSPSDARIFSNTKYLVNVYTSIVDLGNDIDAWERKGKLIRSHFYEPRATEIGWVEGDVTPPDGVQLTNDGDEEWASDGFLYKKEGDKINKYQKNDWYHPENDPERNPFSFSMALDDLYNSEETGFMYYACVVHFADDNSVISDVRSCYCN